MDGSGGPVEHRMRVVAKTTVARDVVAVRLAEPDGGPVPAWSPGAHLDLVLDEGLVRQYSLCGDPADDRHLTVAVLREAAGRGGSIRVHDKLEEGDLVEVRGPRNNFALAGALGYLFVAGGIGITPLLPMIGAVAAAGAPWRLLYGGRTRASMAFAGELAATHPRQVAIHPQDSHGLLDIEAALAAAAPGTAVYCCGPEPLLRAVEDAVRDHEGLTLHVERFAPKVVPVTAADGEFEVELARSGAVVTVPATASILDALEAAGVRTDYSCREGTCGTCEVAVLAGTPDHRDSVLTAEEQAAGDVMMPCVSRCLGIRLVLDL
ncbi:PDR/VanB family oxidoreductase [Nocardia aurantia]|uniref:Phenoxybenzoate dioxygenase subunit beta n=1 Tax=Nocardia aurantia TaxID=2585199 RepID=A0A7K0DMK6_9NOCA|nr:PDR/VanB family oxidoreductase [Nocardia aurantia]MQY26054.1 Phenoxybenzoate dioxygenase subunit beta [Nocardia aurantia]